MSETFILIPGRTAEQGCGISEGKFRDKYQQQTNTLQVAPEDCTGCTLCAKVCPGIDKKNTERVSLMMEPHAEHVDSEKVSWDFFLDLPETDRTKMQPSQ